MDVYLVRIGSNQISAITYSKRRAVARAAKIANDELAKAQLRCGHLTWLKSYELGTKKTGFDAKIWCKVLYQTDKNDVSSRSNSFWVQKHQMLDTPLEMLAQEGE
jgi:hypothetical protein